MDHIFFVHSSVSGHLGCFLVLARNSQGSLVVKKPPPNAKDIETWPEYWSGSLSLLQGIEPRSPTLQANSLPSEPPGKPKNSTVGSLSLLQGIFPTQESNEGLLHGRRILYQLSHQGSPFCILVDFLMMAILTNVS